jgi:hypothetical protein
MISIQVKTCQHVMANEEKDLQALLRVEAVILFMALFFSVSGPWWLTALTVIMAVAMLIPLADYYYKWSRRIKALLAATENVATNYEFE